MWITADMFLRESRHRRKDGQVVTYLQLVENLWNRETGRADTRVVHNFGRADDPPDQVEEKVFPIYPPEAKDWVTENKIPQPFPSHS